MAHRHLLRMRTWETEAEKWRRAVSANVGNIEGEDCFERLKRLKAVAYSQAKNILGVTCGRMKSFIPFHSSHFIRLQARLRLLKAAQRYIYTRKAQATAGPSRAMRRAWDAGWHPKPAPFGNLSHLWDPQTQSWTREWLRELRLLTQRTLDEVAQLRQSELAAAAERRRLEAVDLFWKGGGLRRLLHPTLPTLHAPALRDQLPDSFVVSGGGAAAITIPVRARGPRAGQQGAGPLRGEARGGSSPPVGNLRALSLIQESGVRQRETSAAERIVHTAQDRITVIEHALAMEGLERKCLCPTEHIRR